MTDPLEAERGGDELGRGVAGDGRTVDGGGWES